MMADYPGYPRSMLEKMFDSIVESAVKAPAPPVAVYRAIQEGRMSASEFEEWLRRRSEPFELS